MPLLFLQHSSTKSEPSTLRLFRYVMALVITSSVLLAAFALGWVLDAPIPVAVFAVAAIVSSWYGGLGPGLLATGLSVLTGLFFFVEPVGSLEGGLFSPACGATRPSTACCWWR